MVLAVNMLMREAKLVTNDQCEQECDCKPLRFEACYDRYDIYQTAKQYANGGRNNVERKNGVDRK